MAILQNLEIYSCLIMTGVIWLVQLVHYPSFLFVETSRFTEFERFHQKRISLIVLPLMVTEILSHMTLLYFRGISLNPLNLLSTLAIILIWTVTFFVCLPCHHRLTDGYVQKTILSLIKANWARTFLWSLRSILFFFAANN